ncbi:LysR substrate-binding domain protein [Bordetella bronchiseptica MBORD762]|uniref:LysR family transcriptional regulator n=1 Tax=Bordetella bronchiseptica TaxID=518 RepID=UPI000460EE09|nr:LysR family transcriptional regulator [Bordetella bronchiseptica]KDD85414.1 LysR substrate-binding domain protein [Bordetella bronchiseptica MBORD762]
MPPIETRKLQQFVVLAEELNFRRAAERLHMAQPPLSTAIQQLENVMGVRLFERSKAFVRITPAGAVFLREAHRILGALENASRLARDVQSGVRGVMRVSFVPSAGYAFIPGLARSFGKTYPDVELHLQEGVTGEVLRAVRVGDADMGFVRHPPPPDNELQQYICRKEKLLAVLPTDHPLAMCGEVSLASLQNEDFIVIHGMRAPGFRSTVIQACERAGFEPRIRHEAFTISTMIGLVSEGLGISLVPESANRFLHPNVRFCELTDTATWIPLLCVWKQQNNDAIVQNFLCSLRDGGLG